MRRVPRRIYMLDTRYAMPPSISLGACVSVCACGCVAGGWAYTGGRAYRLPPIYRILLLVPLKVSASSAHSHLHLGFSRNADTQKLQRLLRQYLYYCTSTASKVRTCMVPAALFVRKRHLPTLPLHHLYVCICMCVCMYVCMYSVISQHFRCITYMYV